MDKELMDCLLSDEEIVHLIDEAYREELTLPEFVASHLVAKAQLNSPKLAEYIQEQVKAERERLLSYEPLNEVDKLVDEISLVLLAEWIAIDNGKTRNEAWEYSEQAQELADYLYTIGYRVLRTDKTGGK